jgi:hypothetical protein
MVFLLCRNRVEDFQKWKSVFDSHAQAHRDSGLHLVSMWRCVEEPNNVFFMFGIADMDKAKSFLNDPASAEAGRESGVVDGEFHFIESAAGYRELMGGPA